MPPRTPWKWVIRRMDLMEAEDRAVPAVHHRIPVSSTWSARQGGDGQFKSARMVKVNPDTPQRPVRHQVLSQGKVLLTPQPLPDGFSTFCRQPAPGGGGAANSRAWPTARA